MAEDKPKRAFDSALAYQIWLVNWKEKNPGADVEATKAAWASEKQDVKNKVGKAVRALKRKGYAVPD